MTTVTPDVQSSPVVDPPSRWLRRWASRLVAILAIGLVSWFAITLGANAETDWSDVLQLVPILLNGSEELSFDQRIILHIRLPRVVLGLLVGAGLAISGATLQALFRNPLADPGLIGVSSGAAIGAVGWIVLGGAGMAAFGLSDVAFMNLFGLQLFAFIGAMIMAVVVFRFATANGRTSVVTLLLAGIACNAIAGAVIGLFTYMADDSQLRSLTFWSMGSLAAGGWAMIWPPMIGMIIGIVFLLRSARGLNAMLLGEHEAAFLGYDVEKIKNRSVWLAAWIVANAVCLTGGIGFIGLVVPHLCRLAFGPDHRRLLPAAVIGGALLLVLADILARMIIAPAELPIGILTASLGGPVFLGMLIQQRRRWSA